jgi:hypothetical protein
MYLEITNEKTDMTNRSNNGRTMGLLLKEFRFHDVDFFLR